MSLKHIYFLRPVGEQGPLKIGSSAAPVSRLRTYQIWSPVLLELAASCPAHRNTEQFLHRHFIDAWLHGEWFAWTPEIQSVVDHIVQHGRVPEWVEQDTPTMWREWKDFDKKYPRGKTKQKLRAGQPEFLSPGIAA